MSKLSRPRKNRHAKKMTPPPYNLYPFLDLKPYAVNFARFSNINDAEISDTYAIPNS